MTMLSSIAPYTAPPPSPLGDIGSLSNGRDRGSAARAVERAQGVRDPLQEQPRGRQGGAGRSDDRDRSPAGFGARNLPLPREADAGAGDTRPAESRGTGAWPAGEGLAARGLASAPFLVQVFGQDLGQPRVFIAEHRDAAIRGSEAYRQAGAAPPVYTEDPTLFSFAV